MEEENYTTVYANKVVEMEKDGVWNWYCPFSVQTPLYTFVFFVGFTPFQVLHLLEMCLQALTDVNQPLLLSIKRVHLYYYEDYL